MTTKKKILYLLYPLAFLIFFTQAVFSSIPNLCANRLHFDKIDFDYHEGSGKKWKTTSGRVVYSSGFVTHDCSKGGPSLYTFVPLNYVSFAADLPFMIYGMIPRLPVLGAEALLFKKYGADPIIYFGYFWASCLVVIFLNYFRKTVIPNLKLIYSNEPVETKKIEFYGWDVDPLRLSIYFLGVQLVKYIPHFIEHGFTVVM